MPTFKQLLPWVRRPLLTVPPMAYVSRSDLTIAVANSGALGFLACGYDTSTFTTDLSLVLSALHNLKNLHLPEGISPFGVGFIVWTTPVEILETVFPCDGVTPHPGAIWLFAGKEGEIEKWIEIVREKSPETIIFVQVGSVEEARHAKSSGANILIAQGNDAGGHASANSASIISLVPEMCSLLGDDIPILAAGGIVDARGALAALSLGAEGIVMGSRFSVSNESAMAQKAKELIIQTKDGGRSTMRTSIFDDLRGKSAWLPTHDGRAIINKTLQDHLSGTSEQELQQKYDVAMKEGDYSRLVVYAGTGIGLVCKIQSVEEILEEVEEGFRDQVRKVNERLGNL